MIDRANRTQDGNDIGPDLFVHPLRGVKAMRSRRILLVAALALFIGPASALTQFGQQPGGGFGRGGGGFQGGGGFRGGMMNLDPAERWNQMTGGKDVWVRSQITDQRQQFFFDMMARGLNVTNGQITRDQFMQWSQQMRQRFQNGGFGRGNFGNGPGGPQQGGNPGARPAGQGGPGGGFNPDAMAEIMFRRFDKNGDGLLNYDEMPPALQAERDKWDKNKDGMIDLNEFKEFMKGRADLIRAEMGNNFGGAPPGSAAAPTGTIPTAPEQPVEEETKRVVYRAGKLPKELPAWFSQYDKDGDGQIGLYEWKAAGQPLKDFLAMDRNGDGFLTAEEVLSYQAQQNKRNGGNGGMTASNNPSQADGPGGFGGPRGNFGGSPGNSGGPPSGGFGGPPPGRFGGPPPGGFGGDPRGAGPPGNPGGGNDRGQFRGNGQRGGRQGRGNRQGGG
jgi:Ca2+-binding EF-hand superfamily protein